MKRKIINTIILTFIALGMNHLTGDDTFAQKQVDVEYQAGGGTRLESRMLYHDGQVMARTSNVYLIWYGDWGSRPATKSVLEHFIISIGGSSYSRINFTYPDFNGNAPSGGLVYGGSADDLYSRGSTLSEGDVEGVVSDMLASGALPLDTRGIYLVLATPDITATGFCIDRCQYHNALIHLGTHMKYAFVGNPDRCPASCAPQFANGVVPPNGDRAGDAMASWMAHVVNEIVTNPVGNGWFDRYGLENSDKCIGKFGEMYLTSNGGLANMRLGGRDYLIQQNWVNARKGYCSLSYP
ncbi:MAG TPA: hypothetical protein VFZ23_09760 [Pyrinomonadaceae bacterium]